MRSQGVSDRLLAGRDDLFGLVGLSDDLGDGAQVGTPVDAPRLFEVGKGGAILESLSYCSLVIPELRPLTRSGWVAAMAAASVSLVSS